VNALPLLNNTSLLLLLSRLLTDFEYDLNKKTQGNNKQLTDNEGGGIAGLKKPCCTKMQSVMA